MRERKFFTMVSFIILGSISLFTFFLQAKAEIHKGEQLVRQIFADIKAKNWEAIENKIAPCFQGANQRGVRNRQAEIEHIKELDLGEYNLDNFKVTQSRNVIIVTYTASVKEKIGGVTQTQKAFPRLSVWKKTKHGWQMIAHANLISVED